MIRRFDPRCRLLASVGAAALIASTPPFQPLRYAAYAGLLIPLTFLPARLLGVAARRTLRALPFLLLAAGVLLLREGEARAAAAAVFCNGLLIAWTLSALSVTTTMPEVLGALRQLGAPSAFIQVLALMIRYIALFGEEHIRMDRARESRTARPLGVRGWTIRARQFGELILRAHDRAHRIHVAMEARGFTGVWPARPLPALSFSQVAGLLGIVAVFAAARFGQLPS
jgi:cobalt/nickel transport system permease protein